MLYDLEDVSEEHIFAMTQEEYIYIINSFKLDMRCVIDRKSFMIRNTFVSKTLLFFRKFNYFLGRLIMLQRKRDLGGWYNLKINYIFCDHQSIKETLLVSFL